MTLYCIRHILTLINKVAAVQISCLYLVSTSTPGLGLIPSSCFETDGYYYNKKVANYFSSRRRKQLTTGIMCWLKSNPVSMKGGGKKRHRKLFLSTRLASIHASKYADLDLITAVVHLPENQAMMCWAHSLPLVWLRWGKLTLHVIYYKIINAKRLLSVSKPKFKHKF